MNFEAKIVFVTTEKKKFKSSPKSMTENWSQITINIMILMMTPMAGSDKILRLFKIGVPTYHHGASQKHQEWINSLISSSGSRTYAVIVNRVTSTTFTTIFFSFFFFLERSPLDAFHLQLNSNSRCTRCISVRIHSVFSNSRTQLLVLRLISIVTHLMIAHIFYLFSCVIRPTFNFYSNRVIDQTRNYLLTRWNYPRYRKNFRISRLAS